MSVMHDFTQSIALGNNDRYMLLFARWHSHLMNTLSLGLVEAVGARNYVKNLESGRSA